MAQLKEGDRVRVLVDTPEGTPVDGTVRVVQDTPGKKVGVEFDNYVAGGHSLDNTLDDKEKTDTATGVTYGKGWWTLEDNVEVLK
jgi:hypothetical protein